MVIQFIRIMSEKCYHAVAPLYIMSDNFVETYYLLITDWLACLPPPGTIINSPESILSLIFLLNSCQRARIFLD